MSLHVAILLRPYLKLILDGTKTIESRLTRGPLPPYRRIAAGERIYFKVSAGPFVATAVAAAVEFHDGLTPAKVAALRKRLNHAVCGDEQFWQWKREARYATFITLREVEAVTSGPRIAPSRGPAWFVLGEEMDPRVGPAVPAERLHLDGGGQQKMAGTAGPTLDLILTAGAIRNRYVRVPATLTGPLELLLPDGRVVATSITPRHMLRWRGWGRYFDERAIVPGNVVQLIPVERGRYRVELPGRCAPSASSHR